MKYHGKIVLGRRFLLANLFVAGVVSICCGCARKDIKKQRTVHPNGNVWEIWHEDSAGFKHGKAKTFYENGKQEKKVLLFHKFKLFVFICNLCNS